MSKIPKQFKCKGSSQVYNTEVHKESGQVLVTWASKVLYDIDEAEEAIKRGDWIPVK